MDNLLNRPCADQLLNAASPYQTNLNPACQVPYGIPASSTACGKMVSAAQILDAYNRSQMTPGCPTEPPSEELYTQTEQA